MRGSVYRPLISLTVHYYSAISNINSVRTWVKISAPAFPFMETQSTFCLYLQNVFVIF